MQCDHEKQDGIDQRPPKVDRIVVLAEKYFREILIEVTRQDRASASLIVLLGNTPGQIALEHLKHTPNFALKRF